MEYSGQKLICVAVRNFCDSDARRGVLRQAPSGQGVLGPFIFGYFIDGDWIFVMQ